MAIHDNDTDVLTGASSNRRVADAGSGSSPLFVIALLALLALFGYGMYQNSNTAMRTDITAPVTSPVAPTEPNAKPVTPTPPTNL